LKLTEKRRTYEEAHEEIRVILKKAKGDGVTKTEIYRQTGRLGKNRMSRVSIDRHLRKFKKDKEIRQMGRKIYLAEFFEYELERLKRVQAILQLQEEHQTEVNQLIDAARALGGDEGTKMLNNLLWDEYERAVLLLEKQIELGGKFAQKAKERLTVLKATRFQGLKEKDNP
jgi:hypothetical protein